MVIMPHPAGTAESVGVFGWNYNRGNYKFDAGLRWQRFTTGRKMAMAQAGMFRQDITDLASVSMAKLKVYGPIYGIVITVCVTVFVEGRSGLKFPGPPVFISQIYLQCLAIGMSFMALATWLLFHAAMRAQVACVQLRTRMVRLPVPTQKQLDGSRKFLSTYEEQGLYDIFRVPFVMPNGADSPENSDDEEPQYKGYAKGGLPGIASKVKAQVADAHKKEKLTKNATMPGLTPGHPSWYQQELEAREEHPKSSPSGYGTEGPAIPYEHFEAMREAQKEWWGCEAYMRICFLYGMIHLVLSFSYWITLHNICELGMIWCSNLGAAGLTAGVWIIFRMDVLPEHGGAFPLEIGGPFVTSVTLGMMYGHSYTQTMIDIARVVAAMIIMMHMAMCFRMYSIGKPSMSKAHHQAKEAGGRLFNESGSCESPAWLPTAFQHVMYLIAPPKTEDQLKKEQLDRDDRAIREEAMAKVDMAPWKYLRFMIFMVFVGWVLQLAGHAVECVMGERMLVSNPGQPPWTRTGQWYGWEHGPISSKHYAHVTPQRGHWAWQRGWGPQGQQELWASDMFGFHPEADAWWAESTGPSPLVGIAGVGKNTWATGTVAYGQNEPAWSDEASSVTHDWLSSGGHRRLMSKEEGDDVKAPRALVPLPVQWPNVFEPDFVTCSNVSSNSLLALTASGLLVRVPLDDASEEKGEVELEGIVEMGLIRAVAQTSKNSLLALTGNGHFVSCSLEGSTAPCERLPVSTPPTSLDVPTAVFMDRKDRAQVAVMAGLHRIRLYRSEENEWSVMSELELPEELQVVALSLSSKFLSAYGKDGSVYHWRMVGGAARANPVIEPATTQNRRDIRAGCTLPSGNAVRLASRWTKAGAATTLVSEILI
mmetsp:Transcript_22424/g.49127  ORF Transcript_22424/g.49127 Transcript_22424/m.49127 type:complete len:876 (+) Transcript_22424:90-2717(+)